MSMTDFITSNITLNFTTVTVGLRGIEIRSRTLKKNNFLIGL